MYRTSFFASKSTCVLLLFTLVAGPALVLSAVPIAARTRTLSLALDSTEGLKAVNAKIDPVTYKGRKALRVSDIAPESTSDAGRFVLVNGSEFQDGIIEVDLAGDNIPSAPGSRGFVGIAFRATPDGSRFECFYLRTYNARSEDQLQRNHSAQYISIPEFSWQRLRQEFPAKYEAYVDLVPAEWTKVKNRSARRKSIAVRSRCAAAHACG